MLMACAHVCLVADSIASRPLSSAQEEVATKVATALGMRGWAVCDGFASPELVCGVRQEVSQLKDKYEESEIWVGKSVVRRVCLRPLASVACVLLVCLVILSRYRLFGLCVSLTAKQAKKLELGRRFLCPLCVEIQCFGLTTIRSEQRARPPRSCSIEWTRLYLECLVQGCRA